MPSALQSARSTGVIVGLTIAVLIATGAHAGHYAFQLRRPTAAPGRRQLRDHVADARDGDRAAGRGNRPARLSADRRTGQPRSPTSGRVCASRPACVSSRLPLPPIRTRRGRRGSSARLVSGKLEWLGSTVAAYQLHGRDAALALARTGTARCDAGADSSASATPSSKVSDCCCPAGSRCCARSRRRPTSPVCWSWEAPSCASSSAWSSSYAAPDDWSAHNANSSRDRACCRRRWRACGIPIFVIDAEGMVVAWNDPFARLAAWEPAKNGTLTRDQLLSDRSPATRALLEPLKLEAEAPDRLLAARVSLRGQGLRGLTRRDVGWRSGGALRRHHREAARRGGPAAGPENGGDRPADGRHGA